MRYEAILESFEGPLDLLYHLIEKEKIDIYDIPISKITDQYIEHIDSMKELDLDVTSEFLIMASTLIEIKSKMLLPKVKKHKEDQDEIDPREELVRRLIEYKKYKEVSMDLKSRENTYKKVYYKAREEIEYIDDDLDLGGVDINMLLQTYEKILENCIDFKEDIEFEEIKRDEVTIEESIEKVMSVLRYKQQTKFEELFEKSTSISVVVTTFMAVLELIKQNKIMIKQKGNFSEIFVSIKNIDKVGV